MTLNVGTVVIAPIVPNDSADQYPTHEAFYGLGGLRTVALLVNLTDNTIPAFRREEGMEVYVKETGFTYSLGPDLVTWTNLNSDPTNILPALASGNGGDLIGYSYDTSDSNLPTVHVSNRLRRVPYLEDIQYNSDASYQTTLIRAINKLQGQSKPAIRFTPGKVYNFKQTDLTSDRQVDLTGFNDFTFYVDDAVIQTDPWINNSPIWNPAASYTVNTMVRFYTGGAVSNAAYYARGSVSPGGALSPFTLLAKGAGTMTISYTGLASLAAGNYVGFNDTVSGISGYLLVATVSGGSFTATTSRIISGSPGSVLACTASRSPLNDTTNWKGIQDSVLFYAGESTGNTFIGGHYNGGRGIAGETGNISNTIFALRSATGYEIRDPKLFELIHGDAIYVGQGTLTGNTTVTNTSFTLADVSNSQSFDVLSGLSATQIAAGIVNFGSVSLKVVVPHGTAVISAINIFGTTVTGTTISAPVLDIGTVISAGAVTSFNYFTVPAVDIILKGGAITDTDRNGIGVQQFASNVSMRDWVFTRPDQSSVDLELEDSTHFASNITLDNMILDRGYHEDSAGTFTLGYAMGISRANNVRVSSCILNGGLLISNSNNILINNGTQITVSGVDQQPCINGSLAVTNLTVEDAYLVHSGSDVGSSGANNGVLVFNTSGANISSNLRVKDTSIVVTGSQSRNVVSVNGVSGYCHFSGKSFTSNGLAPVIDVGVGTDFNNMIISNIELYNGLTSAIRVMNPNGTKKFRLKVTGTKFRDNQATQTMYYALNMNAMPLMDIIPHFSGNEYHNNIMPFNVPSTFIWSSGGDFTISPFQSRSGLACPPAVINGFSVPLTSLLVPIGTQYNLVGGLGTRYNAVGANINSGAIGPITLPQTSFTVSSATLFSATGSFNVVSTTGMQTITYTGISSNTFTGCSGGTGTVSNGVTVTPAITSTTWKLETPIYGTKTAVTPGSITAGTQTATNTATVPGVSAGVGQVVQASFSLDLQGVELYAWVTGTNVVSYWFRNGTGSTVALTSPGTLSFTVL